MDHYYRNCRHGYALYIVKLTKPSEEVKREKQGVEGLRKSKGRVEQLSKQLACTQRKLQMVCINMTAVQ